MLGLTATKVLVIDTQDSARELRTWLNYLGCTVNIAECGYSGLCSVRDSRPDVVLCSTGLPRMNGFQVARELRQDPATAPIRLIAIVDFRASTLEDLEEESNFDLHLLRPLTLVKLREALWRRPRVKMPARGGHCSISPPGRAR